MRGSCLHPYPCYRVGDGTVGTEWKVKTEKVEGSSPVSTRNEMDLPVTCNFTLDSARVLEVAESRSCQSSTKSWSTKAGMVCGTCADGAEQRGQACFGAFQLTVARLPADRAWLDGLLSVEQLRYQCPSLPHLKHILGSVDLGLTPGGWGHGRPP